MLPALVVGWCSMIGAPLVAPSPTSTAETASAAKKEARVEARKATKARRAKAEKQRKFRKHRFLPVPVFRFEPAVGATFGVRTRYVNRLPGTSVNRVQVDLALHLSTRLVQDHEIRVRLRDLLGRQEIFQVGFTYVDDPVFPYAGIANDARLSNHGLQNDFYRVSLHNGGTDVNYQEPVLVLPPGRWFGQTTGYLRVFFGGRLEVDQFRKYNGSLLERELPRLPEFQRRGTLYGGLSWDSRDNEWSPTKGGLHDVSFEIGGPWVGSTSHWARFNGSLRLYRALGTPKVVFAQSFVFDGIVGDAPLVALGEFGGQLAREGIGGRHTGRGFFRRRFIGSSKAHASTEIRVEPWELRVWRWTLTPGIKAFMDVGKIFQWGHGIAEDLHVSGGPGMYVVWDRFFVMRADVGFSDEGFAVVVTSDHAF